MSGESPGRPRLGWRSELVLLLLPTATVLAVMGLVEALTTQRLLFASLASSAFLIYLDPRHPANGARTLLTAQPAAALLGFGAADLLGRGYLAAAAAMLAAIAAMALPDALHPPAVSTAPAFALKAGPESNLGLFALAAGVTAALVVVERASLWLLGRYAAPGS